MSDLNKPLFISGRLPAKSDKNAEKEDNKIRISRSGGTKERKDQGDEMLA